MDILYVKAMLRTCIYLFIIHAHSLFNCLFYTCFTCSVKYAAWYEN